MGGPRYSMVKKASLSLPVGGANNHTAQMEACMKPPSGKLIPGIIEAFASESFSILFCFDPAMSSQAEQVYLKTCLKSEPVLNRYGKPG